MKISKGVLIAIACGFAVCLVIIAILSINLVNTNSTEDSDEPKAIVQVQPIVDVTESTEVKEAESETVVAEPTVVDTKAPVISGVKSFEVHLGQPVSYKSSGVTVTDDTDPNPKLTIDNSKVDLSKIGTYYVIYIAEDASGNVSYEATSVNVVPQHQVTKDEANELAQEVLAEITNDDMDNVEKAYAVFNYLNSFGYIDEDYAEATDYHTNGYYFLTTRMGNCRCFFGASKLLLENLGFDTIMVQSKEDAYLNHYWNLLSIDGGETYYHFDPTCFGWDRDEDVFMVCDEWLLEYAYNHDFDSLEFNTDDYPPTPPENLLDEDWYIQVGYSMRYY